LIGKLLEDRINQIKLRFLERVDLDCSRFADVFSECTPENSTKEHLIDFQIFVHKTAGLAGSFGFDTLGKVARRLDSELEKFIADNNRKRFDEEGRKIIKEFGTCCRQAIEGSSISHGSD
jgi:hypothetical protein